MIKRHNEVGLTTWMFHPEYSSNLHCNAIRKCVISKKPNTSKHTTYLAFAHERVKTQNHMLNKKVTPNTS